MDRNAQTAETFQTSNKLASAHVHILAKECSSGLKPIFCKFYFMCISVLTACMCARYVSGAFGSQKRASDTGELELQLDVGAGN